jgi:AcrR family transcriptional regulator
MPARDAKYMENERRKIAAAAYEAALEKGLAQTSLRDICNSAGVTMGGFYVHFKSKTEAIVAAFYLVREKAGRPTLRRSSVGDRRQRSLTM